jgi:hypothetical protein
MVLVGYSSDWACSAKGYDPASMTGRSGAVSLLICGVFGGSS